MEQAMKTVHRLTKNGTFSGDFDTLQEAFDRASEIEKNTLDWTSDILFHWARGPGDSLHRNEYEVKEAKVRG